MNPMSTSMNRWQSPIVQRRVSIAPMMEVTDRHFRAFMRCITSQTTLYTEMVSTGALCFGDRERFLKFSELEHPIALQIGGSNPEHCAKSATMAHEAGYDEINLNVGCPSDRVQEARIGACLMAEPQLVRDILKAMLEACPLPVTIKTRLGIDDIDQYDDFLRFAETVMESGVKLMTIHARKAWLSGLSPKQNRDVPPLWYERVYRFKEAFPEMTVEINGGIKDHQDLCEHLKHVDAVMIGRAAQDQPWWLHRFDEEFYGVKPPSLQRHEALALYEPYFKNEIDQGTPLRLLLKPALNLFQGLRGAKSWRQLLSRSGLDPETHWDEMCAVAKRIDLEQS